jgi:hypothetical protein
MKATCSNPNCGSVGCVVEDSLGGKARGLVQFKVSYPGPTQKKAGGGVAVHSLCKDPAMRGRV